MTGIHDSSAERSPAWRAVGFDLDGTLFDHHGSAAAAVEHLILDLGREPTPALAAAWFDLETRHFEAWRSGRVSFVEQRRLRLSDLLGLLGLDAPDDIGALDALFGKYLAHYRRSWRAFDDAVPLLQRLRAQGMRIGVLTNGNHDQQIDKLRATGLAPLINVVCVSDEIGRAKPDRRAFKILAERLETPVERIAFVGDDREHDIDGARSAGMRAGLVDRAGTPPIGLEAALRIARPRSPGENGDEKDASSPRS